MKIATVFNLLKFEVRRLAPALWLLAVLMLCWFGFLWRLGDPGAELNYPLLTSICMIAPVGLGILIAALVVWLGLGHPSRRADAFWRTRPVGDLDLVVVKFLMVAAVAGIAGVVRWFAFGALGMPVANAFSLLWLPLKVFLVPGLLLLLLATWAGSWRRLFAIVGLGVALVAVCATHIWLDGGVSEKTLQGVHIAFEKILQWRIGADGVGELSIFDYQRMGTHALLLIGAALLGALWCEYRTRRARRWSAILIAGVWLAGLAAVLTPDFETLEQQWTRVEQQLARVEIDEKEGVFEPAAEPGRRSLSNGKRVEQVRLSLDTSWWDGEGQVIFVGGDGNQLVFAGVDSTGVKQSIPLHLGAYTGGAAVGNLQRHEEKILAPLRMVRTDLPPPRAPGFEQLERGILQMERRVQVEQLFEIGFTKGSVSGRLSAAQFVIERIGEVSLATSSVLVQGSGVYRFSEAKVVTVVESKDGVETQTEMVRVDGVVIGLRSWQVIEGRLALASLIPEFQGPEGQRGSSRGSGLILVHPEGVHALALRPEIMGRLAAFGWTRLGLRFDVPLSGLKGIEGSADFPPISAQEVAKMRLILTGANVRKQIKVTIPPTPWQLSYE
jgi:hypothetical protein